MDMKNKICGVCGDKALGYNFNALTCKSCKAFFRRNAIRNKKFSCISGVKCKLDPKTRKYCRKCRLDKCFEIGMKKEWILTDEEKFKRRRKYPHIEIKDADNSPSSSKFSTNFDNNTTINISLDNNEQIDRSSTIKSINNIIILPIFLSSSNGHQITSSSSSQSELIDDFIKTLDKERLIEFVNLKLNLSLPNQNDGTNGTEIAQNNVENTSKIILNQQHSISPYSLTSFSPPYSHFQAIKNQDVSLFPSTPNHVTHPRQQSSEFMSSEHPSKSINNLIHDTYAIPRPIHRSLVSSVPQECTDNLSDSNYNNPTTDQWKISRNVYEHAIRIEYMTEHLCMDPKRLNAIERDRLEELLRIFEPLYAMDRCQDNQRKVITSIEEGFECLESTIKQLIIHIKNIKVFKNLCVDDQLALMKGSISKVRGLLNIMRYFNPTQDTMTIPYPQKKNTLLVFEHECLRKINGDRLYDRCKKFALSFRDDWKNDDLIMNLLIIIMVFFPNRPDLSHREYITLEYLSYCHLLQRYLVMKYDSVCEAKSVYLNLLSRLEELNYFNEECIEMMLMKFDPKYIGPLTFEVYDLDRKLKHV